MIYTRNNLDIKYKIAGLAALCIIAVVVGGQIAVSQVTLLGLIIIVAFVAVSERHKKTLLHLLIIYMPFEPFILKLAASNYILFSACKYWSDLLIASLFIHFLMQRVSRRRPLLPPNPISVPLLSFVVFAAVSSIINLVPFTVALVGLRQLLRYILLYYIIISTGFDENYIKKLVVTILITGILTMVIGLAQAVVGQSMNELLKPPLSVIVGGMEIPVAGTQPLTEGSRIFSTLGRYDIFGQFLVLIFALGLGHQMYTNNSVLRRRLFLLNCLSFVAILLTFSRQSMIALLVILLFMWYLTKKRILLVISSAMLISVFVIVLIVGRNVPAEFSGRDQNATLAYRIVGVFSTPYLQSPSSRPSILIRGGQSIVKNAFIFGVGSGAIGSAASGLHQAYYYSMADKLGMDKLLIGIIGDVGWVSMLGQFGLIGIMLFVWMIFSMAKCAFHVFHKAASQFTRIISVSYLCYFVAFVGFGFASNPFEIRYTSFYFWLFSAILITVASNIPECHRRDTSHVSGFKHIERSVP